MRGRAKGAGGWGRGGAAVRAAVGRARKTHPRRLGDARGRAKRRPHRRRGPLDARRPAAATAAAAAAATAAAAVSATATLILALHAPWFEAKEGKLSNQNPHQMRAAGDGS